MLYLSQAIGRPVLDAARRAARPGRRSHRRPRRPLPARDRAGPAHGPAPDLPAVDVRRQLRRDRRPAVDRDDRHHRVQAAPERDPAARRPPRQADRRHRRPQGRARQRPPSRRRRGDCSTSWRSTSAPPACSAASASRAPFRVLARNLRLPTPERYIDWEDVDPVETSIASIKLRVPHAGLAELHPADLAHDHRPARAARPGRRPGLARRRGRRRRHRGDGARHPGRGPRGPRRRSAPPTSSRRCRPTTRPTSSPDLSDETRAELLALMERDEADELGELLRYPEDTAGGIDDDRIRRGPRRPHGGRDHRPAARARARRRDHLLRLRRRRRRPAGRACCRCAT